MRNFAAEFSYCTNNLFHVKGPHGFKYKFMYIKYVRHSRFKTFTIFKQVNRAYLHKIDLSNYNT